MALEEKVNSSEAAISKLNTKIRRLKEKLLYLESQHELKARKVDDLEQYRCRNCLSFSGFEVRGKEVTEESERMVKITSKVI